MNSMRGIFFPLVLAQSLALFLTGCYTQLATVREDVEERYSYRSDNRTVEDDDTARAQSDCATCDADFYRPRYRIGFRYYYPSYSSFSFSTYNPWYYDPWLCSYDPWICGTPFVGRPYWYNWYWAGYYGGYYPGYYTSYYPYWYYRSPFYYPGVVVLSEGSTRTRDSGYRRTGGATRADDGYGRIGTSGSSFAPPAASRTVSGGSRDAGATRSVGSGVESSRGSGRVRDGGEAVGTSRGTSTGGRSYSPPSRSGEGSSGSAPSSRGSSSGGSSRGSGSTRGRYDSMPSSGSTPPSTPAPSSGAPAYNPPAMSVPSGAVSAPAPSGGGESNRGSGVTRSRD
jgi:hypothetical protein